MKNSLKHRLLDYLRRIRQPIAKGDLCRIVMASTTYTPDNIGRRLRELEVEKLITVEYRRGHAWYKASPPKDIIIYSVGGQKVAEKVVY